MPVQLRDFDLGGGARGLKRIIQILSRSIPFDSVLLVGGLVCFESFRMAVRKTRFRRPVYLGETSEGPDYPYRAGRYLFGNLVVVLHIGQTRVNGYGRSGRLFRERPSGRLSPEDALAFIADVLASTVKLGDTDAPILLVFAFLGDNIWPFASKATFVSDLMASARLGDRFVHVMNDVEAACECARMEIPHSRKILTLTLDAVPGGALSGGALPGTLPGGALPGGALLTRDYMGASMRMRPRTRS